MDLNAARQQAVQDLKQLQFQTEGAALSQRGAALQVEQAQLNLSKVLSDPTATDLQRKQAQLSLDQARLSLREQTDRAKELAKTNQDAQKAGVDGTERVKRAQDNLAKAQDRVLTQQQDLVRAREAVVDAEIKGAQQVAAAQQRVVDARKAVTEADVTGAERIAAAQQRLVSAQRNGARQVLDAQDRVAASQRALAKAQEQSGTAGAAAQKKYAEALAKLSPAGKEFLAFLTQSKGGFDALSKTAQEGFLPGLMDGLKAMRPLLGPVNLLVGNLATSMGGLAREMGQALGSSKGQEFVRFLADNLGPWLELTVRGLAGFATGMGNLWMAFAPVSTMFLTWFADGAAAFAKWTENVGKSKGFNDFIDYLRVNGPIIGGILGDLFKIFGKLLIGLAPLGAVMASVTKALTGFLASCPPPVLVGIATAFGILWAALGGPVAAVVLALVGLGAILVKLWNTNKGFRDFVLTAWGEIRNAVTVAWEKGIKPALSALWRFIQDNLIPAVRFLWTNVFEPAFRQIGGHVQNIWRKTIRPALSELWDFIKKDVGPAISWLWSSVIKPAFQNAGDFIAWTWKNVLSPTLKALDWIITKVLGPTIGWLWSNVVRPNFERIGTAIKWAWDKVIEPVLKAFKWAVEGFGKVFETAKDAIVKHWDKIKRAVGGPITAVVDYVVNPFIGGFNKIGKPFGLKIDKIDTTSWPRFAAGGKIGGPWAGPTADNVLGISDYGQPIARVNPREWIHPVDAVDHYGDERMKAIQTRKAVVLMPGEQLDGYAQGGKVNGGGGATSLPYVRVPGSIPYRPAMRDALVAFGRELQRMGMTVWRNSAFGGKPGSGHAKGSLHYLDNAIDVYSTRNWPAMGDIAWNMAVARGFGGNWQTRLYGDHTNHVHIDTGGYRAYKGPFRSIMGDSTPSSWMASGTASGGGFNLNPFDALKKWLNFDKIKDKGEWAQKFAVGSAKKLIQGAIDWANPLSGGGAGDSLKGGYEALMGYAQMAKKWAPTLSMALSLNKLPATKPYMDAWLTQMMWESSGNPNIIQQIKDVNSGGNEARGILQVTPRTFAAYKFPGYDNIFDPISNMLAGINYAKARYGAEGMLRYIGQGKKHGYEFGTLMARAGAANVAENGPELVVGQQSRMFAGGERVYTAGETRRIFNNLAAGGPLGGGGDTYNLYAARGDVAGDVASTLLTATRRVNRRGRYGGNR